jgi:hypothetical protein
MSIKQLLKDVSRIKEKYDEIARTTGANFNVFDVLGVCSKEDSHSRILASLLDPKGVHDCGDIFLRLFFKIFWHDIDKTDFSDCRVRREYYAEELGRPDICIFGSDIGIVIENKIDAGDQPKQLKRYSKILNEKFKKNFLFYLTLNGDTADEQSGGNVEYKTLSYRNDIVGWLECCQKEVSDKPRIRETLIQYIDLIKILTNQSRSDKMLEETIEKIVNNAKNMDSAIKISMALSKAKEKIYAEKLLNPLTERIKEKLGLDAYKPWNSNFGEGSGDAAVFFSGEKFYDIRIYWSNKSPNMLSYGIFADCDVIESIEGTFFGFKFNGNRSRKSEVASLLKEYDLHENIYVALCKPDYNKIVDLFFEMITEVYNLLEESNTAS